MKRRKANLKERIEKHHEVQFKHVGVQCPSCGYVYRYGFSDVTKAVVGQEVKPFEEQKKAFTICSGCFEPMRVDVATGAIEMISQGERMLWPAEMHQCVAEIVAYLKDYKASMPS